MVQANPPDIVHQRQETARQGIMSSYHHQEMEQRWAREENKCMGVDYYVVLRFPDHDVTPDLVRATEPTYMNENAIDKDQVSLIKNLMSSPVQIGFRFRFWI